MSGSADEIIDGLIERINIVVKRYNEEFDIGPAFWECVVAACENVAEDAECKIDDYYNDTE